MDTSEPITAVPGRAGRAHTKPHQPHSRIPTQLGVTAMVVRAHMSFRTYTVEFAGIVLHLPVPMLESRKAFVARCCA
jgi:hypothetical protein